jgi:two-component system, NtrC family, nitrogen regulation sensor histidine kinase NtrY
MRLVPMPPAKSGTETRRGKLIGFLAVGIALLFGVLLSQSSFDLPLFLSPDTNQQLLFFAATTLLISVLFVVMTFVLFRNLLKLFAERRLGVPGSKFRTRVVVAGLLLSFLPVIVMFWFAYGFMNRSIDKWFSRPVEEVREDTAAMASLLETYAQQNATSEAVSLASAPDTERAFTSDNFSLLDHEFERHNATLQGGFVLALRDGVAAASFHAPADWEKLRSKLPLQSEPGALPTFSWNDTEYILGSAEVGASGKILVAMPLPQKFSQTVAALEAHQKRYFELYRERRRVRRTYMILLLLLTVLVLFATTWLALFLSKLVTRPVVALAEATEEISRGRLDYRVEIRAADEIGDLVRSFNRMAEELESNREQIEASSRELGVANIALEQRRRHIETILETIPTGVLSLDAHRRITHVNPALLRMFHPSGPEPNSDLLDAELSDVFPADVLSDIGILLRRADRMKVTTSQMEMMVYRTHLNVALTAASLQHQGERLGYVLIFEDLSDLLKAQKQAAWREVARRVAHEIKNPLTPIALSAERIRRHLERGHEPDPESLEVIRHCAETIASSVDSVRTLVDEFATLARFPASHPRPADLNSIVSSALNLFDGRLEGIRLVANLSPELPKVMADEDAIRRALANLVDNAAEAMEGSLLREIHVSTGLVTSHDAVEIVVADTGHGVTQELKEKLFLPYFSTKNRGTGLGLAIVNRIVEDHRGSIRVEENRPVGTRFIVELPLVAEPTPAPFVPQHA